MPLPPDPAGLLDRNLRDFDIAYRTFVDDTVALDQLATDWYRASRGHDPAPQDISHGRWRASVERETWGTLRRAFQVAWPIANGGGGDPAWRPTREEARRVRGDYLSLFAETQPRQWFTAQYGGVDPARRAQIRAETKARGYTHLLITWALTYPGYPSFTFAPAFEAFRDLLDELFADHLIPVVVATQMEDCGACPTPARVLDTWHRLVSVCGADRLPVIIHGWEWNDFVELQTMRAISVGVIESCPDALHFHHFTPDRPAASPPRLDLPHCHPGGGPDPWGNEALYWHDMQAIGLTGIAFQSGERDDLAVFQSRLTEIADRLQGKPHVPPAYAGLHLDLLAFEYADPHNPTAQSGRTEARSVEMGRVALTVPGVIGYLNGGPGA